MEQDSSRKTRRIYSTELINQLKQDRQQGYDIDWSPFFNRDLDLRASGIPFMMTNEEMEEYQKCYDDPLYFVNTYCKFMTDKGLSLVNLRSYQEDIIHAATDEYYDDETDEILPRNRNIIICASRQTGKTTTVSAFLSWMMIFHIDRNILVMANKEKTAIEIVDKIINIFKGLPFFLKPGTEQWGRTALKLDNSCKLSASTTTTTSSIGYTIHAVLLDEFAHIPDNIVNDFWRSVYPTLSSSKVSQCIITSTPNGTTNKFYEIWNGALTGKNSFMPIRVDYWKVPGHDEKWAEQMRADFGEAEFRQEFELSFDRGSKTLLGPNDTTFLEKMCAEYVNKHINSNVSFLNNENLKWHPSFDPNNISPNDRFVFLVDLAEGNGDPEETMKKNSSKTPDSNVINIFKIRLTSPSNLRKFSDISCSIKDCVRFQQVGHYCCDDEDEVHTAKVCSALAYNLFRDDINNNVRVMVEMNFNGKSFFEEFKRHKRYCGSTILRTYHKKPIPGERLKKKYGFKTTTNKEYYCMRGNKMISQRRIIPTCKETYSQMVGFGFVRGKLKGIGIHDDLSITVFNHIPRMLDESSFVSWVEEWMMFYADKVQAYRLNNILQKWAMDNPEMSDADFNELYGINDKSDYQMGFNVPNVPTNIGYSGYGSNSPYSGYSGVGNFSCGGQFNNPYGL